MFWTTLLLLYSLNLFIKNRKLSRVQVLSIGLIVLGGYFTKSTAIFLILPGLFFIGLFYKRLWIIPKASFIVAFLLFISIMLLYYLSVNQLAPGYLEIVWNSEYERMWKNIMSWHTQPFNFYFSNLVWMKLFYPYIFLLIIPGFIILFSNHSYKLCMTWLSLFVIIYYLVISYPPVKLQWYDAPVFPALAMLIGLGISSLASYHKYALVPLAFVLCFSFAVAFRWIITKNSDRQLLSLKKTGAFMENVDKVYPHIKELSLLMPVKNSLHMMQAKFYARKQNIRSNKKFDFCSHPDDVIKYGHVIACDDLSFFRKIDPNYLINVYESSYGCVLYKVDDCL